MSLGDNDVRSAHAAGFSDKFHGRPMNKNWLGRRDEVAAAYRDGYENRALDPRYRLP